MSLLLPQGSFFSLDPGQAQASEACGVKPSVCYETFPLLCLSLSLCHTQMVMTDSLAVQALNKWAFLALM